MSQRAAVQTRRAAVFLFSRRRRPRRGRRLPEDGTHLLAPRRPHRARASTPRDIPLRGFHNVANVAAATAIAAACDIGPDAVDAAVRALQGAGPPPRARRAASTASPTTTTASPRRRSARWPPCAPSTSPSCSCSAAATRTCRWTRCWRRRRRAAGPSSPSARPARCSPTPPKPPASRSHRVTIARRGRRGRCRAAAARRRRPAFARLHQLRRLHELRAARHRVPPPRSRPAATGARAVTSQTSRLQAGRPDYAILVTAAGPGRHRPDLRLQLQLRHRPGRLRQRRTTSSSASSARRSSASSLMFVLMRFDYHQLRVLSPLLMLAAVVSLAARARHRQRRLRRPALDRPGAAAALPAQRVRQAGADHLHLRLAGLARPQRQELRARLRALHRSSSASSPA